MRGRQITTFLVLSVVLIGAVALRLLVGSGGLELGETPAIRELRLQRACAGLTVGVALAGGGVMLQSLLRNPLASPDILGLASGAGLVLMIATYLYGRSKIGPQHEAIAALAGSFGALVLVYSLSQRRGLIEPITLVLVGVVVSVMCAAGTLFVQQLMPAQEAGDAMRWLLGGISNEADWDDVGLVALVTLAGIAWAAWSGRAMDAASLSDDEARSVGVRLGALRLGLFVASGVLTAGAVMLAGPIGFVGLICPHVARLMGGPGHRWLVINASLAGGALIVASDALVMGVRLESGRIPIGVITAGIGGPTLIVLLRSVRRW